VIGLVFLNNNLGWFRSIGFDDIFKFIVPVILIILGLNMLFRPRKAKPEKPVEPDWSIPTEAPFKPYSSTEIPSSPLDPPSTTPPTGSSGDWETSIPHTPTAANDTKAKKD